MKDIAVKVETITPPMAKEYLRANTNNYRKLSRSRVKQYAADISAGKWELNGETIVFDENGVLKDGQHRLAGVVMSGKSIQTFVIRGISADVTLYDRGGNRTYTEIAKAMGLDVDSTVVAAGNIIVNNFSGKKGGSALYGYLQKHQDELNRAKRLACYGTGAKNKNAPSVTAAYLMLRSKEMPSYEVELFFRLMNDFGYTHADGYEISPALVAQRMFDERGTKHSGCSIQRERLEILIMAMTDFHKGKKREIKYKISDPFVSDALLKRIRKEDGLE